jgi:uncharacterized DUF497 family protein
MFEWDPAKAAANLQEHGVSFEGAATVFEDPLAKIHDDPDHSVSERRPIIIGHSIPGRMLLVSFADRGSHIRLISQARYEARAPRL